MYINMGKAIFSYDTIDEAHEISINSHIREVTKMIEDIRGYAHHLDRWEERDSIPVDEIVDKIHSITDAWYYIEKVQ